MPHSTSEGSCRSDMQLKSCWTVTAWKMCAVKVNTYRCRLSSCRSESARWVLPVYLVNFPSTNKVHNKVAHVRPCISIST